MRKRLWEILTARKHGDMTAEVVNVAIILLILVNVVGFVLQTVKRIDQEYGRQLYWLEVISVLIFTVEYGCRVACCPEDSRYRGLKGRIRFVFTPMVLVDLLAILPFYMPFTGIDLRVIRILRVFRIFRIFKFGRYYSSLNLIKNVFQDRKEELIMTSAMMFAMLLIASSLVYYAENEAQPQVFSSIPASMWWCVITLTTVGYGDMVPVTAAGKILGGLSAVFGVGMFALPISILGAGFIEEIQKHKRKISDPTEVCPHCGKPFHHE